MQCAEAVLAGVVCWLAWIDPSGSFERPDKGPHVSIYLHARDAMPALAMCAVASREVVSREI